MAGFLSKLFGTGGASARGKAKKKSADPRQQAIAQVRQAQSQVMTPEREALIRHAMQVRKAKQSILADLSDEQRQKLAAQAIRAFLNEGRDDREK